MSASLKRRPLLVLFPSFLFFFLGEIESLSLPPSYTYCFSPLFKHPTTLHRTLYTKSCRLTTQLPPPATSPRPRPLTAPKASAALGGRAGGARLPNHAPLPSQMLPRAIPSAAPLRHRAMQRLAARSAAALAQVAAAVKRQSTGAAAAANGWTSCGGWRQGCGSGALAGVLVAMLQGIHLHVQAAG